MRTRKLILGLICIILISGLVIAVSSEDIGGTDLLSFKLSNNDLNFDPDQDDDPDDPGNSGDPFWLSDPNPPPE